MEYDMPLFRPPSEARSLIFQVTLGCSWNRCLFCAMYKTKNFLVRPFEEVERDIVEMSWRYPNTRKIFLADGDPLAAPTDYLIRVLDLMNKRFPRLERISSYAGPTNLKVKTVDELRELKARKLDVLYLGIETGNDRLLKKIKKGATAKQIIEVCRKAIDAGLRMSTFIILGLGGVDGSYDHAKDSARVANAIDPSFLATLTLMLGPYEKIYEQELMGEGFKLIDKRQSLQEVRWFVEDLELTNCKFGSEHASNYLPISGTLPRDKAEILRLVDMALTDLSSKMLRPDWARGL
ncbi:MAG TPA: radical SAM protein [Deltaproteobacteria bacterium]|nr:radical SAM protein [Deltaproteobacteria bacterium]HPR53999.1 radical SAM protein [Deltaproteobacteria bacterium]HXK46378.1 radical SAM protein [Deltaproteobacteria bacterium]